MLVVLGSLTVGFYAYVRGGRYFARDVVYIAPMLNESHLHFSMTNIELLRRAFPGHAFATESRGSGRLSSSMQEAITTIIYTDMAYFTMHSMDFIEGTHWRGSDENIIVLNEALAWQLFGATTNLSGMTVLLNNYPITVFGVVRQNGTDGFTAWMPHEESNMPITALYMRPPISDSLVGYQARHMLTNYLFSRTVDYAIVDVNRFVESISIRNRLLLYMLWLCAFILLIWSAWRSAKTIAEKSNVRWEGLKLGMIIAGAGICIYVLMDINNILLWLPNLSHPGLSIIESISMTNALPPDGYLPFGLLRLSHLSRYANYAFIAGSVGLVNILFCFSYKRKG